MHRVIKQRALDFHLNPMLEENCRQDLSKYCSDTKMEQGEVRLLMKAHNKEHLIDFEGAAEVLLCSKYVLQYFVRLVLIAQNIKESVRFAVGRPGVHSPSRVIQKDFKKWYSQLPCLTLSIKKG